MPFTDPLTSEGITSTVGRGIDPVYTQQPMYLKETVPAAFLLENSIGSLLGKGNFDVVTPAAPYDPNFDPIAQVPERHYQFARQYAKANNQDEVDRVTQRLDRDAKARQVIEDAGWPGTLTLIAAGVFDPINFIPVGGEAWRTYREGGSVLRGALATGTAAMLSQTAQEAALQATQLSRTWGESALNVGAATLLGGALGGAIGAVTSHTGQSLDTVAKQFVSDLEDFSGSTRPASVGAAAVDNLPANANAIATPNKATDLAVKGLSFQDPLFRTTAPSASPVANEIATKLAETPLSLEKNYLGVPTDASVERLAKNWQAPLADSILHLDEQYSQYIFDRSKQIGDKFKAAVQNRFAAPEDRKLSFSEFRREVGKAMREDSVHDIPQVAAASKYFRENVYDPLFNEAKSPEVGLLSEDTTVTTAPSYLNRVWDLEKLAQPSLRNKAVNVIADWLEGKTPIAEARMGAFEEDIKALDARIADERAQLTDLHGNLSKLDQSGKMEGEAKIAELQKSIQGLAGKIADRQDQHFRDSADVRLTRLDHLDTAERIVQRIEGTPGGRLPYDLHIGDLSPGKRNTGNRIGLAKALRGRVFDIPDKSVEFVLENDIETLARTYVRTMAADVELTRKFGSIDLEKERDAITRHWEDVARKAGVTEPLGTNSKATRQWRAKRDQEITDIMAMTERLRGTYAIPKDPKAWIPRAGRSLRDVTLLTQLAGVAAASTVDTFRIAMVHGYGRLFNDALVPMIERAKGFKLAKQDVTAMRVAVEKVLHSRQHEMTHLEDAFSRSTWLEKGLGHMGDAFGMVTLLAPLTDMQKEIAGIVSQTRILKGVQAEAAGKLTKKEMIYLRQAGVGPEESKLLLKEFNTHGGEEDGSLYSNWNQWTDKRARTVLQSAVGREADRIITTPGQDKTLTGSGGSAIGEMGKILFLFKSFNIASTQRILISGLQQADMQALAGSLSMITMGMMVYAFKTLEAGKELSDDPAKWLLEGVDRSGISAWFMDANNLLERGTGGYIGLNRLAGGQPLSRYASKNVLESLLGPAARTVTNAAQVTRGLAASTLGGEQWTESDTHALRQVIVPFQKLIGFRHVVDAAEKGINSAIGAKQSRSK